MPPLYVPLPNANSGTSAGRVITPVLVENIQNLSGASTATITVPGGAYRELRIISRTTGGVVIGSPVKINFNGDVGSNYDSVSAYAQGSAVLTANPQTNTTAGQLALTGSITAQDLYMDVTIEPLVSSSAPRPFTCMFIARGATDATFITGTSNGYYKVTTGDITTILLTYGSAATGTVETRGIPA